MELSTPSGEDDGVRLDRKQQIILGSTVMVIATVASYWPALRGQFIWDDDRHVSDNRLLQNWSGLGQIWAGLFNDPRGYPLPQYYPLTHTTFWIEHQFWGVNPAGYHAVNILLQAVNALLLWRLLRVLDLPGAWLAAMVFALHPVNVETVAWISERKNLLAMCFGLASMIAFLANTRKGYLWSLALFAAAVLGKTVAASVPAVLLVLMWWRNARLSKRDWRAVAPMLLFGAVMGAITALLERYHVGARGGSWDLSFGQRSLVAAHAVCFYAGKLFWPAQLTFSYPRWNVTLANSWLYVAGIAAVVAALGLLRLGRGAMAAVLIFIGTLLPALGFINVYPMRYSFVADHFQYLSAPALIGAMVAATTRRAPRVAPIAWLIIAMVLGVLTWRQAQIYESPETLWRDTIARNPSSWMARNNLAITLTALADRDRARGDSARAEQRLEEALRQFDEVERLDPGHENVRMNRADTLVRLNRLDEALAAYRAELRRRPDDPALLRRVAAILAMRGDVDDAVAEYRAILQTNPSDAAVLLDLGTLLHRQNRPGDARPYLEQYVSLRPNAVPGRITLGQVYLELHETTLAREQFDSALRLDPSSRDAAAGLARLQAK